MYEPRVTGKESGDILIIVMLLPSLLTIKIRLRFTLCIPIGSLRSRMEHHID